jgi:hypothetical protein
VIKSPSVSLITKRVSLNRIGFAIAIPSAMVSGVDMTITNLQDGKTLHSPVRMFEINLFITTFRLLMIDNNEYPPRPPSEIRQRPIGLAEERRRNGIIRAEPLFHYFSNF